MKKAIVMRICGDLICDFCSDPKPVANFQADDFVLGEGNPELVSRGGWFACEACAKLIEARDWPLLQLRAVQIMIERNPDISAGHIIQCVKQAQALFRKHMRLDT